MNSLAIIFVHNRPKILQDCLGTLFANNFCFDEILIINDGSKPILTEKLNKLATDVKMNIINFNQNQGYATAAEFAFNYVEWRNPKTFLWLEQDYVFKPNGLDILVEVLEKNPTAAAISLYDNPDFYNKEKRNETFPRISKEDFGEDILYRHCMWKPWDQETEYGKVKVEYVSNSCGSMLFNWKLIADIKFYLPYEYQTWRDKVCDKHKVANRNLNDGAMSHGLARLCRLNWRHHATSNDRFTKEFILNIKPSQANHINGGGFDSELGENTSINGHIVPEGTTFVSSPTWGKTFEETEQILKDTNYEN